MIGTVIRIGLLRLRNNPLELVLVFVVVVVSKWLCRAI